MTRYIKWGIWLYIVLLIFEGALRKWVMPGLATPLLVIRDPVVIGIYILAIVAGIVPRTPFLGVIAVLAVGSFLFAFLAGQTNIWVTLFGLRVNYLHPPLIWVMAEVLDRKDVERMGMLILFLVIPMTILMVRQFQSPISAWVNKGVGGDEFGQIYGAMGRIRPPGFFSFITGPMAFFPLAAAFCLNFATTIERSWKSWKWWFVLASGIFIFLAMPISISRGAAIITGAVAIVFVVCSVFTGVLTPATLRFGAGAAIVTIATSYLPTFSEARIVFMSRWDQAAHEADGDAWGSLSSRVTTGFTSPFHVMMDAPFFGHGIGVGSPGGSKLLTGSVNNLLSENEWERAMLELGPILGLAFVGFRIVVWLNLLSLCWPVLFRRRDALPMTLCAAATSPFLLQQWSQPTQLGFAVLCSGLALASLNYVDDEDEDEETDDAEIEENEISGGEAPDNGETKPSTEPEEEREEPLSELEQKRRRMRGLA